MKIILSLVGMLLLAVTSFAKQYILDFTQRAALGGGQPSGAVMSVAGTGGGDEALLRQVVIPRSSAQALGMGSPRFAVGDEVQVRFFDDVQATFVLLEQTPTVLLRQSFLASVKGESSDVAVASVLVSDDGVAIDWIDPEQQRAYRVMPQPHATAVMAYRTDLPVVDLPAVTPEIPAKASASQLALFAADPLVDTYIDILIVYDQGAAKWVTGQNHGTLDTFAEAAVQKMNDAIRNTGLHERFRFRLVGMMTAAETSASLETSLNALRDGAWAGVNAKRTAVGADMVCSMIDTGSAYGVVGKGFALTSLEGQSGFAKYACSVSSVRSVPLGYTMTHEVGHNLGAGHSNAQKSAPGPQMNDLTYSSGYYLTANGQKYCTIMAYRDDGYGNSYTTIPYFSSPDHTYLGVPVGTADKNDNTRIIEQTFRGTANYYAQKIPVSYEVDFEPQSGTIFAQALPITLAVSQPAASIYYTLDGTTPTTASTLYTGAFTVNCSTTVKAISVYQGVTSPVYEARYQLDCFAEGIEAPQLAWTSSNNCTWQIQSEQTFDGKNAIKSVLKDGVEDYTYWLKTTMTGPTQLSFAARYDTRQYVGTFDCLIDNQSVITFSDYGHWKSFSYEIPAGEHEVTFRLRAHEAAAVFYLDQVRFDRFTEMPTIEPSVEGNPGVVFFEDTYTVSLAPSAHPNETTLYYTLDGTTPTTSSLVYTAPLTFTTSTILSVVAARPGRENSLVTSVKCVKKEPVTPGVWTWDIDQVKTAAQRDGKMIVCLLANEAGCSYSRAFARVIRDPRFLLWAKLNGIYLVSADASQFIYTDPAAAFFWQKRREAGGSGTVYYPEFVLTRADEACTAVTVYHPVDNQSHTTPVGSVLYDGTVEALSQIITHYHTTPTVVPAPTISPICELQSRLPVTVTLTQTGPNQLRYVADGAPLTRTSPCYTQPFDATAEHAVQAVALSTDAAAFTSLPVTKQYQTPGLALGVEGGTWTMTSTTVAEPWLLDPSKPNALFAGVATQDGDEMVLTWQVNGPGKLTHDYAVESYSWQNKSTFTVDDDEIYAHAYNGDKVFAGTSTETLTDGPHSLVWRQKIGSIKYYYDRKLQLSNFKWESTAPAVPDVPTWLDDALVGSVTDPAHQAEVKVKFDQWAKAQTTPVTAAHLKHFLLGVPATESEPILALSSLTIKDGRVVIRAEVATTSATRSAKTARAPLDLTKVNGTLQIRAGKTLDQMQPVTPQFAPDGSLQLDPSAHFVQIKVTL